MTTDETVTLEGSLTFDLLLLYSTKYSKDLHTYDKLLCEVFILTPQEKRVAHGQRQIKFTLLTTMNSRVKLT